MAAGRVERHRKVRELIAHPGTPGERQAALEALNRLGPVRTKADRARLTDKVVSALAAPDSGNKIYYDAPSAKGTDYVAGFGVRVTAGGARAFILNYRTKAGRERRLTIGSPPAWNITAARAEAKTLKSRIDLGDDPAGNIQAGRDAPTVADLCARFTEEHLPKKRASTQQSYGIIIDGLILPKLRHMKVTEVTFSDVDALHRKITKDGAPYQANRTVAVLSRMFSLAIKWQWCTANPGKGIERNPEEQRQRYLSADEVARLSKAVVKHSDRQAADIIRLLLLTGARRGEVQAARWEQFDLKEGVWTKPAATTKQAKLHRVPLNGPARLLLKKLHRAAANDNEFVFPGRNGGHRVEIKKDWAAICKVAKIEGVRIHDLRHTFASHLAGTGKSLPIIGALLGHTQAATTQRYAHLLDDPLRRATEQVGSIIDGKGKGGSPTRKKRGQ